MSIKVLHLIDSGGLYGAEIMLLNLVEEQVKAGLEPMILSAGTPSDGEKPLEVEARKRGLPVMPFRMKAGLNLLKGLEVVRLAKKEGYDILHSHGYKFNILLGLIPIITRKIPLITTMHGYVTAKNNRKLSLYRKIESLLLKNLNGVVFVSEQLKQLPMLAKQTCRNQITIHNGINSDYVKSKAIDTNSPSLNDVFANKNEKLITLGAIGRLSKEKGFDLLIEVFSDLVETHPNLMLVIIGEGELRAELERRIDELKLSGKVALPGFVNPSYRIMSEFDVIIMPSLSEGMPITLLEACALGKYIIASRVGGIPYMLGGYPCADTVEPNQPDELRGAIEDFLRKEGADGSSKACNLSEDFSSGKMADSYMEYYTVITGNK